MQWRFKAESGREPCFSVLSPQSLNQNVFARFHVNVLISIIFFIQLETFELCFVLDFASVFYLIAVLNYYVVQFSWDKYVPLTLPMKMWIKGKKKHIPWTCCILSLLTFNCDGVRKCNLAGLTLFESHEALESVLFVDKW